jgi:hypothetical protein
VYLVYVRFVHALEKLARVGRQRLDIATLSLGIDRVESERRFSGAADTGNHGHLVYGYREGDVFEVINAGSLNLNGFFGHTDTNPVEIGNGNDSARYGRSKMGPLPQAFLCDFVLCG